MNLPPSSTSHHNNNDMQHPAPVPVPASHYPIPYFLSDRLTSAKTLKAVLGLDKAPKLRKARITGYQRAGGNASSIVVYDGYNFGEWSNEEVVKGVAFEALNLEEESRLLAYIGECEIREVEIEVACPSLLGKVGMMKEVRGRVFVPGGEGDTLVGSFASKKGSGVGTERSREGVGEERNSYAVALEGRERSGRGQSIELEHVRSSNPHSTRWYLESAFPQLSIEQLDTDNAHREIEHYERGNNDKVAGVSDGTEKNETREQEDELKLINENDKIGSLAAQGEDANPFKDPDNTANTAKVGPEKLSPAHEAQTPQTPKSRKEPALRPVRPELIYPQTPKKSSTRSRKTSDSIRSIVTKYEGLSAQTTLHNTPQKKA